MHSLLLYLVLCFELINCILAIDFDDIDVTKSFHIVEDGRSKWSTASPAMPTFTDEELREARKTPSKMKKAYIRFYDAVGYCEMMCINQLGVKCVSSPLSSEEFVDALQDHGFRHEVKHGYNPFAFWSNCRCSRNEEFKRNDCWALGVQFTRRDDQPDGTTKSTQPNDYYYDRETKQYVWNNGTVIHPGHPKSNKIERFSS